MFLNMQKKNIAQTVEEVVALARVGRSVASIGAILTNEEKKRAELIFNYLKTGKYIKDDKVVARIEEKIKKCSLSWKEAFEEFKKRYPKEAAEFLKIKKEKIKKSEEVLKYGLKNLEEDLEEEIYIQVIKDVAGLTERDSAIFYYGVIKPYLEKIDKEKKENLIEIKVK